MRRILFNTHLYVALVTSLFLLVICVSGCLLVFELSMDRWWDSDLAFVQASTPASPTPLAAVSASLAKAFPRERWTELDVGGPNDSIIAKVSGHGRVFVNPYNGEILGTRAGEPISFHLRHIHRELVAGKPGALAVNLISLLIVFQSVSGIYLWWPLKRTKVKFGASRSRINFDLHHSVGFFSSAFVCILAITGVLKAYSTELQPFFDRVTNSPTLTRNLSSKAPAGSLEKVGVDGVVSAARTQLPGASVARIQPPAGTDGSWVISMKFPGDSTVPGRSWVVVNQYDGRILGFQNSGTAPPGTQITIQNRAIHVGGIYGAPTRVLAFLTAFAVLVQAATGFLMWRRRVPRSHS